MSKLENLGWKCKRLTLNDNQFSSLLNESNFFWKISYKIIKKLQKPIFYEYIAENFKYFFWGGEGKGIVLKEIKTRWSLDKRRFKSFENYVIYTFFPVSFKYFMWLKRFSLKFSIIFFEGKERKFIAKKLLNDNYKNSQFF